MNDLTKDVETPPKVVRIDQAVVLVGDGCSVAYTLDAALTLAHRLEAAVARPTAANDDGEPR